MDKNYLLKLTKNGVLLEYQFITYHEASFVASLESQNAVEDKRSIEAEITTLKNNTRLYYSKIENGESSFSIEPFALELMKREIGFYKEVLEKCAEIVFLQSLEKAIDKLTDEQ